MSSIKGDGHFAHSAEMTVLFFHPGWFLRGNLFIDRAIFGVRTGQISCRHQKFVDNLTPRKHKGLLQDLNTITTVKGYCYQQI